MHVINARNVNDAFAKGLRYLYEHGITESSRNGPVLVAPGPVTTLYRAPYERVLFSPMRDANPFFHFFEALWMLAGRNDIAFPKMFNKRFGEYSDDGITQPAAYGYRWRKYLGFDQLPVLVDELRGNHSTRRAVLQMWDSSELAYPTIRRGKHGDLLRAREGSVDVPCNTHAYFYVRDGLLNMTVCCRSNDIVWGAYGANAVHFSILQEYMAAAVGVPVGSYWQMSNNYHLYTSVVPKENILPMARDAEDAALVGYPIMSVQLITSAKGFIEELEKFLQAPAMHTYYIHPLFNTVAQPMWCAWQAHKAGNYAMALQVASGIAASDWRIACTAWLQRRQATKLAKQASGPPA